MSNASLLQDLSVDHRSPVLSTRSGEIFCCLKDSAVAGHPGALFYLAQCCELGVSTAQDTFRAEGLYRKAAFDGCKEAQEALVLLYTMDDDRFPWGINAANFWRHYRPGTQQVAESQFEVGICYANGHGVPREDTKAAEWLAKAAQQGHAAAQYTLSLCYNDGIGVHKDRSAAAHWLTKAAEHGHPDAQYRLGKHHLNGRRTATDLILAVNWLAQAAELGHVEAQYMLGSMFYHGHGAPRDWAKAIDWFAKAWAGGHPQAQEALDRLRRETSCVATFDDLARP
ncbi:uncharacterized protein BJ171DRAFT_421716 [Polychytrium aggregatum]|uniref:uncharacterized protein n=1 Tax=Polychytrium aggregatum TaxID=110093 RepID=UPI0022FE6E9D|nr:uncharacterized protein BJ171DRAFT_421716 [Polychytrium aggregatum]KAI9206617.1 hypothetical protein BJ171DRAFT_421716 [Polychytrium aggregatum]